MAGDALTVAPFNGPGVHTHLNNAVVFTPIWPPNVASGRLVINVPVAAEQAPAVTLWISEPTPMEEAATNPEPALPVGTP